MAQHTQPQEIHTPVTGEELAAVFDEQTVEVDLSEIGPEDWVAMLIFWLMAGAVILQFFTRYVLNDSFAWTEEIAVYCLIGVVFVGAAMCVRISRHIQVDLIYRYLPHDAGARARHHRAAAAGGVFRLCHLAGLPLCLAHLRRADGDRRSAEIHRVLHRARRLRDDDAARPSGAHRLAEVGLFRAGASRRVRRLRRRSDSSCSFWSAAFFFCSSSVCPWRSPWPSPRCAYLLIYGVAPDVILAQRMIAGVESFPLLAVPFFILAGNLMNIAGVTGRIYNFAVALVGWMKGGLAQVNIIGSVIFSGMSGTAIADAAGIGTIEIKAMKDHGYPLDVAVGVTAASATLGPIIPPSLPFVIYGMMANTSIGALFLAGVIPGAVMTVFMMLTVAWFAYRRGWGSDAAFSWKVLGEACLEVLIVFSFPVAVYVADRDRGCRRTPRSASPSCSSSRWTGISTSPP